MSYPVHLDLKPMSLCRRFRLGGVLSAAAAAFLTLATNASAIVAWTNNINTNNVIIVTNAAYGAVGDGVATNTTAIQNAINAAAAGGTVNGLSGGTVEIPPGAFL